MKQGRQFLDREPSEPIVGLDVGTTGVKAVAIDENGALLSRAAEGYPLATPRPGWAEQDPEDWWHATQRALGAIGGEPKAIGFSGQMHGLVALDANDRVLRPAILWNDQRTAAECAEIEEVVGLERLVALTGNRALTGFTAPKLLWLRTHEPDVYAQIAHVLLPKDYVRLRLTGERVIDVADASGTLLFDVARRLRRTRLVRRRSARTRARLLLRRARHGHAMGVMLSAAGSLRWLREVLGGDYPTLTDEAAAWPPGSDGLLFAPYLTGERTPHADPNVRASFQGLSLGHGRGALVRAVLEGVAYGLRDSLELLRGLGVDARAGRASGGGARSELWLRIVASVLGLPLELTEVEEGAAYGAALLAGVRAGVWRDAGEAVAACVRIRGTIEPDPVWQPVYEDGHRRFRSLYPALKPQT